MRMLMRNRTVLLAVWAIVLGFSRPGVAQVAPTLFVVGDSTANNNADGAQGWGDPFIAYFDAAKVTVVNRARAGRSSRTFQTEGLWDRVLADLKAGDVVLIQFGHNDAGAINDDSRARGSLPDTGEETEEIDNLLTKTHEVVHTYGWYMRKFIADARAKGATPIVLSLTVRNIWQDGKVERGSGQFGRWAEEVASVQQVGFVDLTTLVANVYDEMGSEKVRALFATDHTHTSPDGAELNAKLVVSGLKALQGCRICASLSEQGMAVPAAAQSAVASPATRVRLPEPANPTLPTVFLIGDSTVRNGQGDGGGGQWGWGEPLAAYFDAAKINVVNRAVGGLSSRTYVASGQWDRVLALLKPGDFVVMQFGHNDSGPVNDDFRARGTIKGTGEESEEIDNLLTHAHEVVHSYGWYLRKFITEARAKGATPIVCSLVPRKIWTGGKIERADYVKWAAAVAAEEHALLLDLNSLIAAKYERLGPGAVEALFADANTHTTLAGAELNAASVIEGLKALRPNPLGAYFSAKAKDVSLKFDFGPGAVAPGYQRIVSNTMYTPERGYGFEPGAAITCLDRGGKDALRSDFCTSATPFYFSVALPEGSYKVTVTFGDRNGTSANTVKAELRRLMVERVQTARGKFETRTFVVNIRTPQIAGGGEVTLKDRETTTERWAWDEKLTLEFNNAHPAVDAIEITRAAEMPTIYLLGDSTVCDQPLEPFNSWGQMLTRFFTPDVVIANHAESGESLRSSLGARRLDKVLSTMKPGDYLFIQYGHNDEKERGEGVGAFTTYQADLKRFVDEARKRGGFPVLVTPVQRRTFGPAGTIVNSHGDYPDAVRQVAAEEHVPLIDLHEMSTRLYDALGPEKSVVAFKSGDATHHSNYGSYELAKCIVEGIRAANLDLVRFLTKDLQKFDPAHPDPPESVTVPASPMGE